MPSVLAPLTAFLREAGGRGGGAYEKGGLIKNFNLQTGGLLERGALLERLQ